MRRKEQLQQAINRTIMILSADIIKPSLAGLSCEHSTRINEVVKSVTSRLELTKGEISKVKHAARKLYIEKNIKAANKAFMDMVKKHPNMLKAKKQDKKPEVTKIEETKEPEIQEAENEPIN
jgi:hypothetical protein